MSRYYDPSTGRFINADMYMDTQTCTTISMNMYAYCENDPIMKIDKTGDCWLDNRGHVRHNYSEYSRHYSPQKAIAYASRWAYTPNINQYHYYSNGDCANFVSQCLYAGGMRMSDGWYYLPKYHRGYYNIWFTGSWTNVKMQYNYLKSQRSYVKKVIVISQYKLTKKLQKSYIKKYGIKMGDVMYFADGSKLTHATIISRVADGIYYAAHTSSHKMKLVGSGKNKNDKLYILIMK